MSSCSLPLTISERFHKLIPSGIFPKQLFSFDRLIEDAPFYYDITNYPNSEAKSELIKLYEEKFRYE